MAAAEKQRLEEKQRERRKRMEAANEEHTPFYFEKLVDEFTGDEYYKYGVEGKRDYWQDRKAQDWDHLPDIFSGSTEAEQGA